MKTLVAKQSETDAEFEAWLAKVAPEERAAIDLELPEVQARIRERFAKVLEEKRKRYVRLENVLRRLGFQGGTTGPNLRKAMSAAGFSVDQLATLSLRGVVDTLEERARRLDETKALGSQKASALFRKVTGMEGGRPRGRTRIINICGELLLRKRRGQSQASFARWLRVSRNTYRRAEVDGLATQKTADTIADRLGLELEELVRR